jgi:hypothetical protein
MKYGRRPSAAPGLRADLQRPLSIYDIISARPADDSARLSRDAFLSIRAYNHARCGAPESLLRDATRASSITIQSNPQTTLSQRLPFAAARLYAARPPGIRPIFSIRAFLWFLRISNIPRKNFLRQNYTS